MCQETPKPSIGSISLVRAVNKYNTPENAEEIDERMPTVHKWISMCVRHSERERVRSDRVNYAYKQKKKIEWGIEREREREMNRWDGEYSPRRTAVSVGTAARRKPTGKTLQNFPFPFLWEPLHLQGVPQFSLDPCVNMHLSSHGVGDSLVSVNLFSLQYALQV